MLTNESVYNLYEILRLLLNDIYVTDKLIYTTSQLCLKLMRTSFFQNIDNINTDTFIKILNSAQAYSHK